MFLLNTKETIKRKVFIKYKMADSKNIGSLEYSNSRGKLAEDPLGKPSKGNCKRKDTTVIPKYMILKNKKKILSPAIFIEKGGSLKPDGQISHPVILFEQLLALVCKCYYKPSFQPEAWLREMEISLNNKAHLHESSPAHLKIQKIRGRGGKGESGTKLVIRTTNPALDRRDNVHRNQKNKQDVSAIIDRGNMLDYLISPLKQDHVWGNFTRALGGQGSCHFRVLSLRFRKTV
jgi:hypothetical protein